jgi:predicted transposase/invertase (TIGR01784 family)
MMFLEEDLTEDILKELVEMDSSIKNAEEKLEYLSSDPATIELYKKREESLHERANMISSARADGISEGRFEEKVGVALASFKEGLSIELVSKITGLSLDELEEIQKKYLH